MTGEGRKSRGRICCVTSESRYNLKLAAGKSGGAMRSFVLRACAVLAVVCFPSTFGQSQQPIRSNESVWFALQEERGKLSVDPIGMVIRGKILRVPTGCADDDPEFKKFEARYLQPPQTYSVTFGGAPAGVVALQRPDPNFGSNVVQYDGVAHIRGRVMALATNAKLSESETSFRQAPSSEERKLALQFANDRFAESGLPATLLQKTKIDNLTHTMLAPAKSPALIGSFSLDVGGDTGLIHGLFFIATERNGKLIPEFVWVHISEGESAYQALSLVDHADLLGDGQGEVVALLGYYESYSYRIYHRTKEGTHWEQIFETEALGCL
jgi:hypothetical protein